MLHLKLLVSTYIYFIAMADTLAEKPITLSSDQKRIAVIVFNATLPMMQFTIDGTSFHTQLLKMNTAQLQQFRQSALNYFAETFGINAQDHSRDVAIRIYETNPLAKMRCIYLSGEKYIPPEGFVVRDGGVMMTIINPHGLTLGGKYAGKHIEFGTTFSVGHWVIQRVNKSGDQLAPLIWMNRHVAPGGIATYEEGSRSFHGIMEVISEEWGVGESLHIAKYTVDKGKANAQFRNVITF